eukprot:6652474-Pyramimonas_sp.AAC.1
MEPTLQRKNHSERTANVRIGKPYELSIRRHPVCQKNTRRPGNLTGDFGGEKSCLLYTSPSPRDRSLS